MNLLNFKTSFSPAQLSAIKAIEIVIFLALSAAVAAAYPLLNTNGSINWQHITVTGLAVFVLVIIFTLIEYLKQSIQQKLLVAEKAGQPTQELQNQLSIITAIEGSISLIADHSQSLAKLIPNITTLIATAQQTATTALQNVSSTTLVPPPTVSTAKFAYAVDEVSSTTGTMPAVNLSDSK